VNQNRIFRRQVTAQSLHERPMISTGLPSFHAELPAHGDVEPLAESSLYPFVEFVWSRDRLAGRK